MPLKNKLDSSLDVDSYDLTDADWNWWNNLPQVWKNVFLGNLISLTRYKKWDHVGYQVGEGLKLELSTDDELKKIINCERIKRIEFRQRINDVAPLAYLKKLQYVALVIGNEVDFNALTDLLNLKELAIWTYRDDITIDIKPISLLSQLTSLHIANLINSDISLLGKLVNLERLSLSSNRIKDITAIGNLVKLKYMYLYNNEIENIEPLAALTQLSEVYLKDNQIKDISSLSNLNELKKIDIRNNLSIDLRHLADLPKIEHILYNAATIILPEN